MIENTTPATSDISPDVSQPDVQVDNAVEQAQSIDKIRIPGTDKFTSVNKSVKPSEPPKPLNPPEPKKNALVEQPLSNNAAAQRRINRSNDRLKERITELEQQIARLKPEDPAQAAAIQSAETEINTYTNIIQSQQDDDFEQAAVDAFGNGANEFMEQTYRYAKHVNRNEPELLAYMDQPFGLILLREWYKHMDNPQTRAQWVGLSQYQKGAILNNYYSGILQIARAVQTGDYSQLPPDIRARIAPQTAPNGQPAQRDIPAATGGRQSNSQVPSDDFGLALQQAQQVFSRGNR